MYKTKEARYPNGKPYENFATFNVLGADDKVLLTIQRSAVKERPHDGEWFVWKGDGDVGKWQVIKAADDIEVAAKIAMEKFG